ncbi:N-acetyltransferase GCN5 [Zopfochytrium polystomum]|nr:N-acetyltransferase GCN5 [Zopfochytrium polystomum]
MSSNKPVVSIRAATVADVPTIFDFIKGLAIYEKLEREHVGTHADLTATLFGERPYAHVFIASLPEKGDVGFCLYFFNYSTFLCKPGIYLEDLFVKEEARGLGVGKALLKHLAKEALRLGCGRLDWQALDWNTPAINFYLGIGAKSLDEWKSFRLTGENLTKFAGSS